MRGLPRSRRTGRPLRSPTTPTCWNMHQVLLSARLAPAIPSEVFMRLTGLLDLTSRRGFIGNLAIAALIFATFVEPAQPARADSVDDYIRAQIARRKIPCLALAVVQRGKVVKLAGYGLASVELEAPVTPDT